MTTEMTSHVLLKRYRDILHIRVCSPRSSHLYTHTHTHIQSQLSNNPSNNHIITTTKKTKFKRYKVPWTKAIRILTLKENMSFNYLKKPKRQKSS
jgi:hypothetical protein